MTSKEKSWYIPDSKSAEAIGPYSQTEIEEKVQEGTLRVDDFVWAADSTEQIWKRMCDLDEFKHILAIYPRCRFPKKRTQGVNQSKRVKISYAPKLGNLQRQNDYRRYPRAPIQGKIVMHNHREVSIGELIDISEKGLFASFENHESFQVGQQVVITIINHEFLGTFSLESVLINSRNHGEIPCHGVYFLQVNPALRRGIANYVINKLGIDALEQEQAA